MEFKITEAQALEMAKFEDEVGCDISAGADWGINLDRVMELAVETYSAQRAGTMDISCPETMLKLFIFVLTFEYYMNINRYRSWKREKI